MLQAVSQIQVLCDFIFLLQNLWALLTSKQGIWFVVQRGTFSSFSVILITQKLDNN